jgi:hypothetical protein
LNWPHWAEFLKAIGRAWTSSTGWQAETPAPLGITYLVRV